MIDSDLLAYYSRRVAEYEQIYEKSERQHDLIALEDLLVPMVADQQVLEIACGTGYWTSRMSSIAELLVATDASATALSVARKKVGPPAHFVLADAYSTPPFTPLFSLVVAGFWWSHVPLERLDTFIATLHAALRPSTRVVFFDNRFVQGSSTPISHTDSRGNTYQERRLSDGSSHSVLKNFPSIDEITDAVYAHGGHDLAITELTYFWLLSYRSRPVA